MPPPDHYPTRRPLLVLALACALSPGCATTPPAEAPIPPPDLFARAPRPTPEADALTSEAAYERWVSALDAWGRDNARRLDAACRWWRAATPTAKPLRCGEE